MSKEIRKARTTYPGDADKKVSSKQLGKDNNLLEARLAGAQANGNGEQFEGSHRRS